MWRTILAVLAGLIAGGIVVYAVEWTSHLAYPPAPGLDLHDPESVRAFIAGLPIGALLLVLAAWAAGSFTGGLLAARIARRSAAAAVVGVIQFALGILNLVMIPHPLWFAIASVFVFLPFAFLGGWLGSPEASSSARVACPR